MTKIRILFYIAKILILFLYRFGTIWFNIRYLKKYLILYFWMYYRI